MLRGFTVGIVAAFAAPAMASVMYFDFGAPNQLSPGNYNNMVHNAAYPAAPAAITNAIDDTGAATGVTLDCTDIFWPGTNFNGTTTPSGNASVFNSAATQDSFFGSTVAFGGFTEPTGGFTLSGLNPGLTYRFTFFASRTGVTDNREAAYAVSGASSDTVFLNASNNVSEVAVTGALVPNANGTMTISVGPGPNNNNGSRFYYLGAMRIEAIPEPSSMALLALGAAAATSRRRRA